jgi:hypothetical protein
MDDYIYIIALIAWVVFAFYRKSQKKSQAAREAGRQPQQRDQSRPFPTLEEILLGKEPVPEAEEVPEPAWTYTTDGMAPEMKETLFEKEYNRQGITSIEEMDKQFNISAGIADNIQKEEVLIEDHEGDDFESKVDLRKAVIYSEILNRPYV